MEVILYTTNCPKCRILEAKLKQKGIAFDVVDGENILIKKGFMEAPKLEVDEEIMGFSEALNWINNI